MFNLTTFRGNLLDFAVVVILNLLISIINGVGNYVVFAILFTYPEIGTVIIIVAICNLCLMHIGIVSRKIAHVCLVNISAHVNGFVIIGRCNLGLFFGKNTTNIYGIFRVIGKGDPQASINNFGFENTATGVTLVALVALVSLLTLETLVTLVTFVSLFALFAIGNDKFNVWHRGIGVLDDHLGSAIHLLGGDARNAVAGSARVTFFTGSTLLSAELLHITGRKHAHRGNQKQQNDLCQNSFLHLLPPKFYFGIYNHYITLPKKCKGFCEFSYF